MSQPTATARETYPDGRLVPIVGDEVFQAVPGLFGTPASIRGEVYRHGGKLRVRITGVVSLIGGGTKAKTYQLTPHWTVVGDPEMVRREAAKKERDAAQKAQWAADAAENRANYLRLDALRAANVEATYAAAIAAGEIPFDADTIEVGDIITIHDDTPWSDPDEAPILLEACGRFLGDVGGRIVGTTPPEDDEYGYDRLVNPRHYRMTVRKADLPGAGK